MDCMKIMEFVYVSRRLQSCTCLPRCFARSKLSKELADELLKVNLGDLKTTRLVSQSLWLRNQTLLPSLKTLRSSSRASSLMSAHVQLVPALRERCVEETLASWLIEAPDFQEL